MFHFGHNNGQSLCRVCWFVHCFLLNDDVGIVWLQVATPVPTFHFMAKKWFTPPHSDTGSDHRRFHFASRAKLVLPLRLSHSARSQRVNTESDQSLGASSYHSALHVELHLVGSTGHRTTLARKLELRQGLVQHEFYQLPTTTREDWLSLPVSYSVVTSLMSESKVPSTDVFGSKRSRTHDILCQTRYDTQVRRVPRLDDKSQ